jgi:hypothetical protein
MWVRESPDRVAALVFLVALHKKRESLTRKCEDASSPLYQTTAKELIKSRARQGGDRSSSHYSFEPCVDINFQKQEQTGEQSR